MMTHDIGIEPSEELETKMTHETFEQVINEPATEDELSAGALAEKVYTNKNASIILKSILHNMLASDGEGTQDIINETVFHHALVEPCSVLLDIKFRE